MSSITRLHDAVKVGTYPLHVSAEFGRPDVTKVLLDAGSDVQRPNKHGLTPLACARGGANGQWQRFSNATLEDWRRCVELLQGS